MDDRLANRLYENNPLAQIKEVQARVSLLEKLHVKQSVGGNLTITGGNVTSVSDPSTPYNFALFASQDGKYIIDEGISAGTITPYGSIFYFDETAADVAGYKTLTKNFNDITAGTSTKACTVAVDDFEVVEEFISEAIGFPFIIGGVNSFLLYVTASVPQTASFICDLYKRDALGNETLFNSSFNIPAALDSAVETDVVCWNVFTHTTVDVTDRLVVKVKCRVALDTDITIRFGEADFPAYFSHPFSMQAVASGVTTDITLTGDGTTTNPLHTKVVISASEPAVMVAEMLWVDTT